MIIKKTENLPNVLIISNGSFPKTCHKLPYLFKQNESETVLLYKPSLLLINSLLYYAVVPKIR